MTPFVCQNMSLFLLIRKHCKNYSKSNWRSHPRFCWLIFYTFFSRLYFISGSFQNTIELIKLCAFIRNVQHLPPLPEIKLLFYDKHLRINSHPFPYHNFYTFTFVHLLSICWWYYATIDARLRDRCHHLFMRFRVKFRTK